MVAETFIRHVLRLSRLVSNGRESWLDPYHLLQHYVILLVMQGGGYFIMQPSQASESVYK